MSAEALASETASSTADASAVSVAPATDTDAAPAGIAPTADTAAAAPNVAPMTDAGTSPAGIAPMADAAAPAPNVAPMTDADTSPAGIAPTADTGVPAPNVATATNADAPGAGAAPATDDNDPAAANVAPASGQLALDGSAAADPQAAGHTDTGDPGPAPAAPAASLDDVAREKLEALERRSLRRELAITERRPQSRVRRDGTSLVSFACNDYLGLSQHPDVVATSAAATVLYGAGAGAARLVTGNHPLYTRLEERLAALKGTEDAVVFGSGYLANTGLIPAVAGRADLILVDELAHSCLRAGAKLAGSRVHEFRHNDAGHVAEMLDRERAAHRHCLIVTEGVFSMDGDLAPLAELAELAERHGAWLMTDDAHGLGVVGDGRGSAFAAGVEGRVPLQMGTLSKAVGSYGGYLCASRVVCDLVRNRAASFVYSTGLPPGAVAAAAKALEIIANDRTRARRPTTLAARFTERLGLRRAQSPIVPLVLGSAERALEASAALAEQGFLVTAIRPPTVPPGTARLRFTFSAPHTEVQVDDLARAVEPFVAAR